MPTEAFNLRATTPTFDDHHVNAERPLIMEPGQNRDTSNITKTHHTMKPANVKSLQPLRYRKRSLWLLGCYLPFLIVPWVLTCIMAIRPLSLPSYYNQRGDYGSNLYLVMLFWLGFVRVLNSIASLITVPVVSALLAQGAVVFSQRRKKKQALSLRQTFALADRGWNDIPTLWSAATGGDGKSSKYLWLAAGLLLLSAIQAPVQQALVSTETITIMTCQDQPVYETSAYCDPGRLPTILAFDPEPYHLSLTPQNMVVREVMKKLATVNEMDIQQHLWHEPSTNVDNVDLDQKASSNTFFWFYDLLNQTPTYFVSALANDTTTGILREHAIRLNSTVDCEPILAEAFPSSCGGQNPFVTSIDSQGSLSIDICLPGDFTATAWNLTRDRQDIQEQLYIKVHIPYNSSVDWGEQLGNFTVQCTANSTRGYFELGNVRNNFTASGIIEKWPDNDTLWNEYNDYLGIDGGFAIPSAIDTYQDESMIEWVSGMDPFGTGDQLTPGPLMTSALAMFGNESFFYVARNSSKSSFPGPISQICQAGNIPFTRLTIFSPLEYNNIYGPCSDINSRYTEEFMTDNSTMESMLYQWFGIFNLTGTKDSEGYPYDAGNYAKKALEVGMFFANEAWLVQTAAATYLTGARNIYTSPGTPMFRPAKTLAGTIIVSVLIFLQIIGLSILAWYVYTVPTWTNVLDSMAVSQLAKSVDDDKIPPLGYSNDEELAKLKDVDGLVGIADEDDLQPQDEIPTPERDSSERHKQVLHPETSQAEENSAQGIISSMSTAVALAPLKLARGGPGLITRQHAPPKKRKWKKKLHSKEALLENGDMNHDVMQ
ncbi:hypothetical protein B7494_g4454 [Chlorociboria aeruginascens]|nr:hypothetical protein B7494_g4454 [Chlorociboria aeruginascens]